MIISFKKASLDMKNRAEILVFPDNDRLSKIFPAFSLGFSFNEKIVSFFRFFSHYATFH